MRTPDTLKQLQSLPLDLKISLSQQRIRQWVYEFGESGCYLSFSGGKDSTVLLDIVRNRLAYHDIPVVFVDTGLEFPEIRSFVKSFDNVVWLKPKLQFRNVIEKYGYPFISKEVSGKVYEAKLKPNGYAWRVLHGSIDRGVMFDITKWSWLIDSPFKFGSYCCNAIKKSPIKQYEHLTGRKAISAIMACESKVRSLQWLKHGCNAFDKNRPISNPLSFWTEQDILLYLKTFNIPYCSVYGDIVVDYSKSLFPEGQLQLNSDCSISQSDCFLKTTGCSRTGCMFCGFGCHLEKPGEGRFERLKFTHPSQYTWIMKDWDKGGLGYKNVIDWLNAYGNLNIRY